MMALNKPTHESHFNDALQRMADEITIAVNFLTGCNDILELKNQNDDFYSTNGTILQRMRLPIES